jgi:hypothetical protein
MGMGYRYLWKINLISILTLPIMIVMETTEITVNDLIKSTTWEAIWKEMPLLYSQVVESEEGYKEVFAKLESIIPEPSDLVLFIKIFFEEGKRYADFAAYNEECPEGYSMMASSWASILGLTISRETFDQLSSAEIIAHCLYEMTWFGSSEEEIEAFCEDTVSKFPDFKALDKEVDRLTLEETDELELKKKIDALMSEHGFSDFELE